MLRALLVALLLIAGPAQAYRAPPGIAATGGTGTNTTLVSPTLSGSAPLAISIAPTVPATGDIVSNYSVFPWPSTNTWDRVWSTTYQMTGTYSGNSANTSISSELSLANSAVGPTFSATVSGGAVTAVTTVTAGSNLPPATYNLYFAPSTATASGAAGTFVVSGGAVVGNPTVTAGGTGYTTVPAVDGIITSSTGELDGIYNRIQLDAGTALLGQAIQTNETGFFNQGVLSGTWLGFHADFLNSSNGIVSSVIGLRCDPGNQNPNVGSWQQETCVYMPSLVVPASAGSGGSVTATAGAGVVTLSIAAAGSGYTPGTYNLAFNSGCALPPVGQFTVNGSGNISATSLSYAGLGCTSNPSVYLNFGSPPLVDYAFRVDDPMSTIATLGNVLIGASNGVINPAAQESSLSIQLLIIAPDTSASTNQIYAANQANKVTFQVLADGEVNVPQGTFRVGTNGSAGTAYIYGSGSGATGIAAVSAASGVATLPANTGTIAELNLAQTFSAATTFSSSVLFSGLASDSGKSDATVCDVTASGTLYYGSGTGGICLTTSTARFKDHIEDAFAGFSGGLHVLRELFDLRTVQFNYKPGYGFDPKHRYWGWTAEQMEGVFPELVGHDAEGKPNSVDMMGMLPRVVAAVQAGEYLVLGMLAGMIALTFYCAALHVHAVTLRWRLAALEAAVRAGNGRAFEQGVGP